MKWRHALRKIFPPARQAPTVRHWLPCALFLGLYIAGNIAAVAAGRLAYATPWAFALLLVTPWIWWMHVQGGGGLRGVRGTTALLVRLCVVGAFIMLLAEPRGVRKNDALAVVYALDLSDSVGEEASNAAMDFINRTIEKKPERDMAGLVVFGGNAAVELPPRLKAPFEGAINSRVARDATNLEKGLSLAAAMLPEDHAGRIVLISDGTATEGNLAGAVDQLAARKAPVLALPIEYQYEHEVWLDKVELPKVVKVGESYQAVIILSSIQPGSGTLTLRENDQTIFQEEVSYEAGKNRFALPLYLRAPGYYEYIARITPPPGRDGRPENNIAINHLYLKGEGKVMLVVDPSGDPRDWESLSDSLKRSERIVERKSAYEFPRDALSLMPYDSVVFCNVAADAFDVVQLQAMKEAVYNLGCGFLMVGGANSFGPGGYHRTAIEETLPVSMDMTQRKVMPAGALIFVLDRSGSMSSPVAGTQFTQQQVANRATVLAMNTLLPGDWVGVLAFDTTTTWAVPLQQITDMAELERKVWTIGPNGGTDIYPALKEAFTTMQTVGPEKAAIRHVILLSDGQTQGADFLTLVKQMAQEKITLSTVAIGDGANYELMDPMAVLGGGTPHHVKDPNLLPKVFIKEATTLRRSMIQNRIFTPDVEFPSPILQGVGALQPLRGYVLTTPKEKSQVVLKGPGTDDLEPVLATWRFGLGKAAAFTSDFSPNWGAAWVNWDKYDAFLKQLVIDISKVEMKSDLLMEVFAEGSTAQITVKDYHPRQSFLQVEARVAGPQGRTESVSLRQVGPGRYQAQFPLWGTGRYQVAAIGAGDGRNENASGGFAVPYSPEYLRFRSTRTVLEEITRRTGGRMLTGGETSQDIFPVEREPRRSSRPVTDWFLVLLACLIPLDVGVRRVQLDWGAMADRLRRRRRAAPDQTLSALLRRKQEIKFTPTGTELPRVGKLASAVRTTEPQPRAAVPHTHSQPAAAAPQTAIEDASTTSRLLARKKSWKKEGDSHG